MTELPTQTPGSAPHSTIGAALLLSVLRARIFIARGALGAAFLVGIIVLLSGRTWTSETQFVMEENSSSGGILALAAQYGLGGGLTESGMSPAFIADFLGSDEALRNALEAPVSDSTSESTVRLIDYLEVAGTDERRRHAIGIRALRALVSARASARTGVVTLSTTMPSPFVAEQVTRRLLQLVGEYATTTRQSQAMAQRDFTASRLKELEAELREAEESLAAFVKRNRGYANDPELQLRWQRLARVVDARSQLVNVLSQAHEQARIDAVRDTPSLTIVVPARVPGLPDRRGLLLKLLFAFGFGALAAFAFFSIRNRESHGSEPVSDEFSAVLDDARHPLRFARAVLRLSRGPRP